MFTCTGVSQVFGGDLVTDKAYSLKIYLSNLWDYENKVKIAKRKVEQYDLTLGHLVTDYENAPRAKGGYHSTIENKIYKLERLERIYNDAAEEYAVEFRERYMMINQLEDSMHRVILCDRYLLDKKIEKIMQETELCKSTVHRYINDAIECLAQVVYYPENIPR